VRAGLLERLAEALANLGRFDAAAEIRAEVVALRERELGPEHVLTLEARSRFHAIDRSALAPRERAARLEGIESAARRRFGADHDLELETLAARATQCSYDNDHVQSERLFRLALGGWLRRGLGEVAGALDARATREPLRGHAQRAAAWRERARARGAATVSHAETPGRRGAEKRSDGRHSKDVAEPRCSELATSAHGPS
jgi:hypothetical protein